MTTTGKRAQSGEKGTTGGPGAYREVMGLTGPLLPVMSSPARLPTATIQFGSALLVARTSGSLAAAGLTGGAPAVSQVACGPLVGRLANRQGQRAVVLVFSPSSPSPTPSRSPGWSPGRSRGRRRPCWCCSGPAPG